MTPLFLRLVAGSVLSVLAGTAYAADSQDPIGQFEISRFDVRGNTLLPAQTVAEVVAPFAGKQRDFGHVQKALEALEAAYHARGFNVIQVALPEQELNQGVVVLQVVEARLAKVTVSGSQFFDEANIRRSVPGLTEEQTPNIADISASLKLANENPAKKARLQLQRGAADGEVEAVLKITDERPWKIGATLDNTGNSSIGKTRMTVQYQHANVANLDHLVNLQYSTTVEKPDQIAAYGIGYRIPLYALGDSVDVYASYSNADFIVNSTPFSGTGTGTMFGSRYTQNLRRAGNYASSLIYGFDYKAYRGTLQGMEMEGLPNVTVHPLSLAYLGHWTMIASEADFSVSVIRNISGGDRGRRADFNRERSGAEPEYRVFRYNAAYSRALFEDWQMRLALSGQLTSDALVSGEKFGIGGATSVRGFDERDVASDKGHLFNAEIYTPNFCAGIKSAVVQCRAVGFYDAGRVKSNSVQPGEVARASLASVGIGLRVGVDKNISLQMDYGHIVDSGIARLEGDERLHVRLGLSY